MCATCERPTRACVCAFVEPIATRSRIVVLQHPREAKVGVGTVRLAKQVLSSLEVVVDDRDSEGRSRVGKGWIDRAVAEGAFLVFPSPGARIAGPWLRDEARSFVFIDGTWPQARQLLRRTPELRSLPLVALEPRAPSTYRIRRAPSPQALSTIEAMALVLEAAEPTAGVRTRLLAPFHAMVARQLVFSGMRPRRSVRKKREPKPRAAARRALDERDRLVLFIGEANAFSHRLAGRPDPELVHLVSKRPGAHPEIELVARPSGQLAPATPERLGLSADVIASGAPRDAIKEFSDALAGRADRIVVWGYFAAARLSAEAGELSPTLVDLKPLVRDFLGRREGDPRDAALALGASPALVSGPRALGRLHALEFLLQAVFAALRLDWPPS